MWQICGYIPQTMENPQELTEIATQLSTSFILETFIHAKEKVCPPYSPLNLKTFQT